MTSRFSIGTSYPIPQSPSRQSVASTTSASVSASGSAPTSRPTSVLQRPLARTRGTEAALPAWDLLFAQVVTYTQRRVQGIADFEARLNILGYRVGSRLVHLLPLRDSLPPSSRSATGPPRQIRLLPLLSYIHTQLYRTLFSQPANGLERSTDNADEYMIYDNDPLIARSINVPKEMSQLSCIAFLAGLVESVMDASSFPCRVTAHSVPTDAHPRRTVLLIKLHPDVVAREESLGPVK